MIQIILIRLKKLLPTTHYPLLTVMTVVMITACGYKPSAQYIQNVFTDKVHVEVIVDAVEPENAPYVKDEMNRIVYTRFKGRVVSKAEATSKIVISYAGSSYIPLAYEDGYVTRYRANTRVNFAMETKKGKLAKKISTVVEADIQASSLTSSYLRIEALRKGLEKALDEFMAYASAKGIVDTPASE